MAKKETEVEKKGKEAPKKDAKKAPKKPNIFVRIGRKFKETFSELKRVTWPTVGNALKSTGVVIVIVLIFLVLITLINIGFTELLELLTSLG